MQAIEKLKEIIASCHSAIIAFSGGVDSTFPAVVAKTVFANWLLPPENGSFACLASRFPYGETITVNY